MARGENVLFANSRDKNGSGRQAGNRLDEPIKYFSES
jgi:hypothetical protein